MKKISLFCLLSFTLVSGLTAQAAIVRGFIPVSALNEDHTVKVGTTVYEGKTTQSAAIAQTTEESLVLVEEVEGDWAIVSYPIAGPSVAQGEAISDVPTLIDTESLYAAEEVVSADQDISANDQPQVTKIVSNYGQGEEEMSRYFEGVLKRRRNPFSGTQYRYQIERADGERMAFLNLDEYRSLHNLDRLVDKTVRIQGVPVAKRHGAPVVIKVVTLQEE